MSKSFYLAYLIVISVFVNIFLLYLRNYLLTFLACICVFYCDISLCADVILHLKSLYFTLLRIK